MREIKFRAWEQNIKLMAYPSDKLEMSGDEGFSHLSQGFDIDDRHITLACQGWDVEHEGKLPCIIMQYTGLKDRNGRDCYEGDIVSWEINNKLYSKEYEPLLLSGIVTISIRDGVKINPFKEGDILPCSNWGEGKNNFEIIGNIYEDAGLLAAAPPCP